ncbi:MAG: VWA domain-containing protein [Acidobacteria bacterium]|nr:MAG: VWA domain-containing protein [Acidobacteriota bacterium]
MTLLGVPSLLLAAAAAVAPSRPVFRSEIGLVVLQATVKNARGEVIKDLDRGAFTVYENGKRQTLSVFHRDDVPVSLGILIDNSGSMKRKRAQVETAALALVRASNPDDEVFVLNFGDKPRLDVPFTRDLAVLEAGIRRVDAVGGTAMRDAIEAGESYLSSHAVHDRRVLLVVTDGNDNASTAPMGRIRQVAEGTGTVIDAIGLLAEEDPPKARRAREDLDELTEATGGMAYYPHGVEEVGAIALELAAQIRSQYTLGYSPVNQALDGSYRKLRVVAKGPERLVVRTRAGYRALAAPEGAQKR